MAVAHRPEQGPRFARPTLLLAGRQDSTAGYAAAWRLLHHYPRATLAVLDRAGHALPHEQPALLGSLVGEWLDRSARRQPLNLEGPQGSGDDNSPPRP